MRSMIKNGSDDRPPNFVLRGTTKWWIPYDIRNEGAVPMRRSHHAKHDQGKEGGIMYGS